MSYVSFYRKWRPQTFSEIIGQDHIVQTLRNSILNNRISHSYIFCGPRGTGKTSLARIFAKAINCINGPTSDPCNKCDNCVSISAGVNMDVIEIDAASNRGIEDIRDLREKVKYLPANLRKKVYIIDEAHQITSAASNAFLKVLEEPPGHVVFIMATTEPHEVIPTIMSRCQRFDFEPIKLDKIKMRLADISRNEGININEPAINLIAKYADGSLRDADGILEQLSSFGDSKITVDDVTSLLGIIDQEMLFEFANILLEKNISQGLLFTQRLLSSGLNLKIFVTEFLEHLYNLFVIKSYDNPLDILDINEDVKDRYFHQAGLFKADEIEAHLNLFSELLKQIKWGDGSKTFFKTAIIKAIKTEIFKDDKITSKFKKIDTDLDSLKSLLKSRNDSHVDISGNNLPAPTVNADNGSFKPEIKSGTFKDISGTLKNDPGKLSKAKPILVDGESGLKDDESGLKDDRPELKDAEIDLKNDSPDLKDVEKIIQDNWNNLLSHLKEKNISIHAMFKEAKSFKVKENTVCFYLDENKKWHKDHLNKNKNSIFIQESLKSITGRNYKIIFDFIDAGKLNKNDIKDIIDSTADLQKKPELPQSDRLSSNSKKTLIKNTNENVENNESGTIDNKDKPIEELSFKKNIDDNKKDNTDKDIYTYLEDKFNINNG